MANQGKYLKRMESKKSHSWWWDSHISPKNSKWLSENLEEMDRSVKKMLKLIEEDADSFAKKAELYFQKRPELVAHVEDFYRIYRSLAERYDHVTGELRKNVMADFQTQSSGVSDSSSDIQSSESRQGRRRSGVRAPGFDVFLGSGGGSADMHQEGDESSSLTDSEPESDASSINNYTALLGNGNDPTLNRKVLELEFELREAKERLQMQQNEHNEDLLSRIVEYEQELRIANEKIRYSDEEIVRLKIELQKLNPEFTDGTVDSNIKVELIAEKSPGSDNKFPAVMEALRSTKEKLKHSEKEIAYLRRELEDNKSASSEKLCELQDQLELANKEITSLKSKLNKEKRDVSRLQERVTMLKSSLSDRGHEVRDLKIAVSDAEQKIFPEKAQIKAELSKLLEERVCFEEQVKEWEQRGRSLEDEIRNIKAESAELKEEVERLKADIAEKGDEIENLSDSLDATRVEKDELNAKLHKLEAEMSSKDCQFAEMNIHLNQLHVEQAKLIADEAEARKQVEELKSKAKELEQEVEQQRVSILQGAEEKREAIRQLCISIDHYRNGYQRLRQAYKGQGHKRLPVLAS